MDFDAIPVFVKVVQTGSFSKAARLLGMPNTTVSAKVARLERDLGVTLIQRTTRKLHITQAGDAYFQRCLRVIEELKAGEEELASSQKQPRGVLKVTAPVDLGQSLLPSMVKSFHKKYPELQVDLIVTNRIVDLVAEGVDLGIRAGKLEDSTLIAKKYVDSAAGLWASSAYLKKYGIPAHPKELSKHQFIGFSPFSGKPVTLWKGKESLRVELKGKICADDFGTIKQFVVLGMGIGLIPNFLCLEETNAEKLVRVLPDWQWGSGRFSIVYPAQRFVSPKVQAFIQHLTEETEERLLIDS